MKKLFVSIPMKNRTKEEIKNSIIKMHKIAEVFEGEQLELIDSYVENDPPVNANEAIWFLAKSIEKLSEADIFIGIEDEWNWSGCHIEAETAGRYGIKTYRVPPEIVINDYKDLVQRTFVPVNSDICCETVKVNY